MDAPLQYSFGSTDLFEANPRCAELPRTRWWCSNLQEPARKHNVAVIGNAHLLDQCQETGRRDLHLINAGSDVRQDEVTVLVSPSFLPRHSRFSGA